MILRQIKLKIKPLFVLTIMVPSILFLSACGNNHTGSDPPSDSGSISFKVAFQSAEPNDQRQAAVINCVDLGLETIEAEVYDPNYNLLADGGPWECESGEGIIEKVGAGEERTVNIIGKNSDGNVIYHGKSDPIKVIPDSHNNAGIIDCSSFIPVLQTPLDTSTYTTELVWAPVAGASEYCVLISKNEDLSDASMEIVPSESYSPEGLEDGQTYYWLVYAIDDGNHGGVGSKIWSFVVRSNMIQDSTFDLTQWEILSQPEKNRFYWWLDLEDDSIELDNFDAVGKFAEYGDPAVKIHNKADGSINWLWEKDLSSTELKRTFPISIGKVFYIEASVSENTDCDPVNTTYLRAVVYGSNHEEIFQNSDNAPIRPQKKGKWETVKGVITITERNPDTYLPWRNDQKYQIGDIVKIQLEDEQTDKYFLFRCIVAETSGAAKKPPNLLYWERYGIPEFGTFGIASEGCTTGYFLVDDVILSPLN